MVNGLGLLGVLGLATTAASSGALSVGDVVAINALVLQLAIPLNNLGGLVRVVQSSVVDLSALRELLARSPEVKDGPPRTSEVPCYACLTILSSDRISFTSNLLTSS